MARLLWLADVLRAAGLTVNEYPGWRERGLSTFGPVRGIVCHGTAGSWTSSDAGELRVIAITGSNSATAPIAQLYLSRSGAWWVVASGTCTGVVSGTGGPLEGYSDDAVLQIEAQHAKDEPWSATQYDSYVRGVAALARHRVPGYDVPLAHVIGHYEHQPTGPNTKSDPWFDMGEFRRDVQAVMDGDDMPTGQEVTSYVWDWGPAPDGYNMRDHLLSAERKAAAALALLEKIAEKIDIDPAELEAIKTAAQQGVVSGSAQLAAAVAAALKDELGLTEAEAEAAAERALRRVLGRLDEATAQG